MQNTFNVGWSVTKIDERKLKAAIDRPWGIDGKTFSQRIWTDQDKLVNTLRTGFTQMLMTNSSPANLIKKIQHDFDVSKGQAKRLVNTESAYIAAEADKECYKDLDVEQYEILVSLSEKTCEVCGSLDGKVYPMSEFEPGVTAPPIHANCRCTTVPYFDDDFGTRAARDEHGKTIFIPANMKYEEWKAKVVDKPVNERYNKFKESVHADIKNNYSLKLNVGQQDKHIVGTNNYIEGRSILTANPQKLIDLYAGKSNPIQGRNGEFVNKERFTHTDYIGEVIDKEGSKTKTKSGIIHYSQKKGVHIVPAKFERSEIELTLVDI